MRSAILALAALFAAACSSTPAPETGATNDAFSEADAPAALTRVLTCEGNDASMELYLPESVVSGLGIQNADITTPVFGAYALDLTSAGKGLVLEPVKVSLSADKKGVVVDQYTRGLPKTTVPILGGTVDFDQRFGTGARCKGFNGTIAGDDLTAPPSKSPITKPIVAMRRVLACNGTDASMEVFLPEDLVGGTGPANLDLARPTIGLYSLDLSAAEKGKPLEPVKLSWSADTRSFVVNQYTRGLPPTSIPLAGGTVDFDQRFGTEAACIAVNTERAID